jgi:hypothetical protein
MIFVPSICGTKLLKSTIGAPLCQKCNIAIRKSPQQRLKNSAHNISGVKYSLINAIHPVRFYYGYSKPSAA